MSQLNTAYLKEVGFPTPRFHPQEQLPELREGEVLGKFYGVPVRLPGKQEGEIFDRAGYTEAQRQYLRFYEFVRRKHGLEALRNIGRIEQETESLQKRTVFVSSEQSLW